MSLGNRLYLLRKQLNLSQSGLGELMGVSHSNISGYERDKQVPKCDSLKNLYYQYKVNLTWLVTGEGEMFLRNNESSGLDWISAIQNDKIFFEELVQPYLDNPKRVLRQIKRQEELEREIRNELSDAD